MYVLLDLITQSYLKNIRIILYLIRNKFFIEETDGNGMTPLIWASKLGVAQIVQSLIENGACLDRRETSVYKDSAVSWAVFNGHYNCVVMLIDAGADINTQTMYYGNTLLMWSVKQRHYKIFRYLLNRGSDIRIRNYGNEEVSTYCDTEHSKSILQDQIVLISWFIKKVFQYSGELYEPSLPVLVLSYY